MRPNGTAPDSGDFLTDPQWLAIVDALRLSGRETDLLRLAIRDDSVVAMAASLGITQNTVHTHRQRLFRKLGVASFSQALVVLFKCHVQLERAAHQRERLRQVSASPPSMTPE